MEILKNVLIVAQIVITLILIITVLLQQGNSYGLSGSIAGGAETFFGKNKGRTDEAKKSFLTKIFAGAFLVIVLVASIVMIFA